MTDAAADTDAYVILLPVLNGAAYLPMQLDSIAAQTDTNWRLIVSDDGSSDDSRDIMQAFADQIGDRVVVRQGPNAGLTAHMIDLISAVPDGTGPVALADQDDLWFRDKIESDRRALAPGSDATLLCRRTRLCDAAGHPKDLSPPRPRPPGFGNALVQNIASGNTMVFNRALFATLKDTSDAARGCAYHDWWFYQIATGSGAHVLHLDSPKMLYRQHDTNLVGVPRGPSGLVRRAARFWTGRDRDKAQAHLDALVRAQDRLTPGARSRLSAFQAAQHGGSLLDRLTNLARSGVYRQASWETALLWLAALRGRV